MSDKNKRIYIGAAYYPEMWDECEVDKDIARCKQLGIDVLRVGEFAWGKMEPREGVFEFDWLLSVVDKLYANGIYTVMCTPTATPPRWMLDKYNEMRRTAANGVRDDVSSRCHICKTSPVAREKNRIIVTEMAKVFGAHKGIIGWQIDNEIFPYGDGCYCPQCKAAFRDYLENKFGSVENLNKAWGMVRWSLDYESFDAIEPPVDGQWRHPSLKKAWWDFQCDRIYSYVDEQADILHKYTNVPIGTDMMATDELDYYKINRRLDVVQFNHYNPARDLAKTSFSYDFLRCVKDKPFWVTETQVGWNGSWFAACGYRPVGNCYANTWLPIALGAEMNMYWLFRTHPSGHELAHGALYSAAGRAYRVSEEVKDAVCDIKKCESFLTSTAVKSRIAIHYSNTAANNFTGAAIVEGFKYRDKLIELHSAFKHYNTDVIDTPHSLDGYDVLISPFTTTLDENGFAERVTKWVENGGTWIVGPMSDIMDENTCKYTHAPYSFLEELAGVYTKYQKPIDNDVFGATWADGTPLSISTCFDAYEPQRGTRSLANYSAGEFTSLSVVTERKVGKGKVILVGSALDANGLLRLVNSPRIAKASDNIILSGRSGDGGNGIVAVETENRNGHIELDGQYKELITGKKLSGSIDIAPHSVLVLVKN